MVIFRKRNWYYGSVDDLRRYCDEALSDADVIGLAVGTRPDCVPDPVLASDLHPLHHTHLT
ncbi:hypothetical protein [Endozoicomonas montiporae]|nr:hypothetical protein [Endozoicomonas montiporae]